MKKHPSAYPIQSYVSLFILIWLFVGTIVAVIAFQKHENRLEAIAYEEGTNRLAEHTYKQPIFSISENRAYFPEAKAYLPFNETTRNLKYVYQDRGGVKELTLAASYLVGRWHKEDNDAPNCVGIVTISSSETTNALMKPSGSLTQPIHGLKYISQHEECKMYKFGPTPVSVSEYTDIARNLQAY